MIIFHFFDIDDFEIITIRINQEHLAEDYRIDVPINSIPSEEIEEIGYELLVRFKETEYYKYEIVS